jgi:hypothetical protein
MERTHRQRRRWWAALALAVVGCSDTCGSSTQPGAVGELGNGRFLYTCGGPSDPACEGSTDDGSVDYFPDCIALGGAFDLEYELIDGSALETGELTPVLYIESVNQGFFRGTDDFEALRVGSAAFLVRESERVLDLIHLAIVEPDYVDVVVRDTGSLTDAIALPPGATEVLLVLPRSSECLELGGAVPIEANSSDPAVATVMAGEVLRIQAIAPGTAVVRARLGEIEQMITVTVSGEPVDPDTGPGEESTDGSSSDEGTTGTATTDAGTTGAGSTGAGSTGGSGSSTTGGT